MLYFNPMQKTFGRRRERRPILKCSGHILSSLLLIIKSLSAIGATEGNKYNTLLDIYEPGVTVAVIDRSFWGAEGCDCSPCEKNCRVN